MKVKINKRVYEIPPISKLTVLQYMKIIDKVRYTNLVSYISALSGREIDSAEVDIDINKINIVERTLLDVKNVAEFDKIEAPNLYNNEIVKGLYKDNWGAKYVFNLYRNSYNADNIGIIELCVYAFAIMLSKKEEYEDVEDIYQDLLGENWMTVIPIGFFLSKKLNGKKRYLTIFLTKLMLRFNLRQKRPQKVVEMRTI